MCGCDCLSLSLFGRQRTRRQYTKGGIVHVHCECSCVKEPYKTMFLFLKEPAYMQIQFGGQSRCTLLVLYCKRTPQNDVPYSQRAYVYAHIFLQVALKDAKKMKTGGVDVSTPYALVFPQEETPVRKDTIHTYTHTHIHTYTHTHIQTHCVHVCMCVGYECVCVVVCVCGCVCKCVCVCVCTLFLCIFGR